MQIILEFEQNNCKFYNYINVYVDNKIRFSKFISNRTPSNDDFNNEIPEEFICPICYSNVADITLSCDTIKTKSSTYPLISGHSFCKECLDNWYKNNIKYILFSNNYYYPIIRPLSCPICRTDDVKAIKRINNF